jgi:hypothetical protein
MALFTAKASATGNSPQLAHPQEQTPPALPGLTGRTSGEECRFNRNRAGVNVKAVGFHLRRIFGKLGI